MFVYDIKVYNNEAKLIRHNKMLSDHTLSKLDVVFKTISGTSGQWRKICCSCTYNGDEVDNWQVTKMI